MEIPNGRRTLFGTHLARNCKAWRASSHFFGGDSAWIAACAILTNKVCRYNGRQTNLKRVISFAMYHSFAPSHPHDWENSIRRPDHGKCGMNVTPHIVENAWYGYNRPKGRSSAVETLRAPAHSKGRPTMQELVTVKRAAELLHVTPMTVRRLTAEGKLPVVHIGRAVRYEPEAIEALVAANRK